MLVCYVVVSDPDPDPYLWLVDPDLGGPKTCGSGSKFRSGSGTLVCSVKQCFYLMTVYNMQQCTLMQQKNITLEYICVKKNSAS